MKGQNIGYIRVSSTGQNTVRQLEGIELDKKYTDIYTGSVKNRPQLVACLEYIREGDTLHVHSIDRFARNLLDLQTMVNDLVNKGIAIKFHTENLEFKNDDNPIAKLTLQIMGSFAEFERKLSKSRQSEGIAAARKAGKHLGRPKLKIELKERALILKSKGLNVSQIAQAMELSRPSIYKLLKA